MWWRQSWLSLNGTMGIQGKKGALSYATQLLSTSQPIRAPRSPMSSVIGVRPLRGLLGEDATRSGFRHGSLALPPGRGHGVAPRHLGGDPSALPKSIDSASKSNHKYSSGWGVSLTEV